MNNYKIRIITYNLLSSKYSKIESFVMNNPLHLDQNNRLSKILIQLNYFINNKKLNGDDFDKQHLPLYTILSLQEVSIDWKNKLCLFFEDRNYKFTCTNYGNEESGNMGVGIAYPKEIKVIETKINKINHLLKWDIQPPADKVCGFFQNPEPNIFENIQLLQKNLKYNERNCIKERNNEYVAIKFENNPFWIVSVHMPCIYWKKNVMNHWCQLLSHTLEKDVQLDNIIIAGDFNHSNESESSSVLKNGMNPYDTLNGTRPINWPKNINLPLFEVRYKNNSIHSLSLWGFKRIEETPAFHGKIDHIYYRGVKLLNVEDPPYTDELLPNEIYPSDHLPVGAIFELNND